MLNVDWNALRPGDSALVHDVDGPVMTLAPGVVAVVNVLKGSNGVGIRVKTDGGGGRVVWPSRLAVHLDPSDPSEPCWRCQALRDVPKDASTAKPPPRAGRPPKTARDAWIHWQGERSASAAAGFYESVSSWIEGTAAQLLRPMWPSNGQRPSAAAVETLLRDHLGRDLCAAETNHVKALAIARQAVLDELRHRRSEATRGSK